MKNNSDAQFIKPAVVDPLINQIDRQIKLLDDQIAQYESMLIQTAEMMAQLEHIGRTLKASNAIATGKVKIDCDPDGDFYMTSFTDPSTMYEVSWLSCSCPDHVYRNKVCKHMIAFRSLSDEKRLADLEAKAQQAREDLGL